MTRSNATPYSPKDLDASRKSLSDFLDMTDTQPSAPAPSWSAGLPEPKSSPPGVSHEELVQLVRTKTAGKDYIVVDVRRDDFKVRFFLLRFISELIQTILLFQDYAVPYALNLPAHSFYQTRDGVVSVISKVPLVIFHCQSCSSPGSRGRKVAAYYQDALDEKGIKSSSAAYLEGGIKGWIEKYKDDKSLCMKI